MELGLRGLVSKRQSIFEPLHLLKGSSHVALTDILVSRFRKIHCLLHALLTFTYLLLSDIIILLFHFYFSHFCSPYSFFFLIATLFIYLFIYLFFSCVGSLFRARAFSSCGRRGPLFIVVRGPALLTLLKHFIFWVNCYFKFTDLAYNPWALQEKSLPKSKTGEIFLAGR